MALPPYVAFPWPAMGSPLTPFIALKFRGFNEFYYTFPDKTTNIYVDNAEFAVWDSNGYSTATITLVDPDFYNLESIFLKAIFIANSLSRYQGNWFCAAFWGWSYYGEAVGEGDSAGQRRTSGIHYYMLTDINYQLTDVDLKVTFTLADVGSGMFEGDEGTTVGLLNVGNGVTNERAGTASTTGGATAAGGSTGSESRVPEEVIAERWNRENPDKPFQAVGREGYLDFETGGQGGGPSATPTASGSGQPESYQNVITGKSYWQIIQIICAAHNVEALPELKDGEVEPTDGPSPGEGGGKVMSPEYGRYIISTDELLSSAVNELKMKIGNQPENAAPEVPTKRWDLLAGGKATERPQGSLESDLQMPWGWIPQPPKSGQVTDDYFRLARTLTYRPGDIGEIARGETLITNLTYNWTTQQTILGVGLPPVYVTAPNDVGEYTSFYTLDDFEQLNPEAIGAIRSNPSVQGIPLTDLVGKLGVELQFNFDTRTESTEAIEIAANTIIVNVWNLFAENVVEISATLPGDPWLDNQLFNSDGSTANSDILVDLYKSFFKVKIYKLSPGSYQGSSSFLSDILSGNYICRGCTHTISDGDYSTALSLLKPGITN